MKLTILQKSNLLALCILGWGSTAMLGHIFDIPKIKGLGLASGAAPYTKVFCQAYDKSDGRAFETFAMDFELIYDIGNKRDQILTITPEIYQKMKGPYQRRNVYGAVLAYGPAMPSKLSQETLYYSLIAPGKVPSELGLPKNATHFRIRITSRTAGSTNQWTLQPSIQ